MSVFDALCPGCRCCNQICAHMIKGYADAVSDSEPDISTERLLTTVASGLNRMLRTTIDESDVASALAKEN